MGSCIVVVYYPPPTHTHTVTVGILCNVYLAFHIHSYTLHMQSTHKVQHVWLYVLHVDSEMILESNLKLHGVSTPESTTDQTHYWCMPWHKRYNHIHGFVWPATRSLVDNLYACIGQEEAILVWFPCPHCITVRSAEWNSPKPTAEPVLAKEVSSSVDRDFKQKLVQNQF